MSVYTKTGDKGQTSLFDNKRVDKDDIRVESYGTIDELNTLLGLSKNYIRDEEIYRLIHQIQRKLFDVGAELATEDENKKPATIKEDEVIFLEKEIDKYTEKIKKPDHFIVPGAGKASAFLHVARTVCRRAERRIITLSKEVQVNPHLIKYVNRLSDLIYILSRYIEDGFEEVNFN
ncbi:cob(I)yrinic acid a,c-diamide adenosyltransferase [Proteiniborus sp. MB09-C3]|uniref:cob(I)yrinic acid a,c-diamide adenosyltransferase n=1 Tax=Proteiniborus sp. MB09-C3 TaxID=3050072 RepID=UPI0025566DFE|nr:cob(I)yrinic acid a,c-diamide adenosyltransferase [Proteiniborus sp. MB09-C3]WIV13025.1 cob(I)yrinic acid a,c-diamide adenosyltransferase [Proteiniborus sp. MB09-C3]